MHISTQCSAPHLCPKRESVTDLPFLAVFGRCVCELGLCLRSLARFLMPWEARPRFSQVSPNSMQTRLACKGGRGGDQVPPTRFPFLLLVCMCVRGGLTQHLLSWVVVLVFFWLSLFFPLAPPPTPPAPAPAPCSCWQWKNFSDMVTQL